MIKSRWIALLSVMAVSSVMVSQGAFAVSNTPNAGAKTAGIKPGQPGATHKPRPTVTCGDGTVVTMPADCDTAGLNSGYHTTMCGSHGGIAKVGCAEAIW